MYVNKPISLWTCSTFNPILGTWRHSEIPRDHQQWTHKKCRVCLIRNPIQKPYVTKPYKNDIKSSQKLVKPHWNPREIRNFQPRAARTCKELVERLLGSWKASRELGRLVLSHGKMFIFQETSWNYIYINRYRYRYTYRYRYRYRYIMTYVCIYIDCTFFFIYQSIILL